MIEFEKFKRSDEINEWLLKLDDSVRGSLNSLFDKYEKDGKLPKTAGIMAGTEGIGELRFKFGPGYRVYFCRYGGKIIILLLNGGDKDTQPSDIKTAKAIKARELKKIELKKER